MNSDTKNVQIVNWTRGFTLIWSMLWQIADKIEKEITVFMSNENDYALEDYQSMIIENLGVF